MREQLIHQALRVAQKDSYIDIHSKDKHSYKTLNVHVYSVQIGSALGVARGTQNPGECVNFAAFFFISGYCKDCFCATY